ncbi:MAG: endonuclease/exonuclease/phosphatase family protein, partial [Chloroflexota bacterium]
HHGNAILTRLPLQRCRNVDLSLSRWEHRGLLHAVLELPATPAPLHVISTHLNLRNGHRKRQLELIRGYLEAEVPAGDPVILAGDFNDWRRRAAAGLAADLSEAFVALHGQPARTFPSFFPVLRLDRVFARNLEPVHAMQHPRHASASFSDHAALAVRLRLPETPASALKRVEWASQAGGHAQPL